MEVTMTYKIDETTQMRDAVIGRLYDLSDKDSRLIFCTADMGAKTLDLWREREKEIRDGRFNEFGIAEQAMADVAAGMAKEGKRPFIYAIANFVTKRIHEFHALNAGVQQLPYVTIGVGTGYSYPDSGPTHYMLDDITIMRAVPNLEILSPSDSIMAADLIERVANSDNPVYMRLERAVQSPIYSPGDSLEQGFNELKNGNETCLISTGNMVNRALEVRGALKKEGEEVGVIDIYRLKPLNQEELTEALRSYNQIVSIEEHYLAGGLGSILSEMIVDRELPLTLKRIGVPEDLPYIYGRENIHRQFGLDTESLTEKIRSFNKVFT